MRLKVSKEDLEYALLTRDFELKELTDPLGIKCNLTSSFDV